MVLSSFPLSLTLTASPVPVLARVPECPCCVNLFNVPASLAEKADRAAGQTEAEAEGQAMTGEGRVGKIRAAKKRQGGRKDRTRKGRTQKKWRTTG